MKLSLVQKLGGLLLAVVLASGVHAQTATLTADQQAVITLASSLYPDLFTGSGAVTLANGYVTQSFSSGVTVGFRDGAVFTSGGMFGSTIQNRGTVAAVTNSLTNLKNSVNVTPSTDITSLFNLAAQVYPTLMAGGTSFQTSADGYLYKYFSNSGIYAAVKNGSVFLKGGSYGNAYASVGALNAVLTKLQTTASGSSSGSTSIPSGNYNLTVSGNVTIAGPVSISQPFSVTINGVPAPNVSDQDAIRKAFTDSLAGQSSGPVTITNFSYTTIANTASLVEFDVSVSATISQSGFSTGYTYKLKYRYTK